MRTRIVERFEEQLNENGEPIMVRVREVIEVDNAWILANRPPVIALSIPQLSYSVGQSATLTAQLKTPELADFSQENLSENRTVQLHVGDASISANLVNGVWQDTLNFAYAGTYRIECLDMPSNILEVVVT